MKCYFNQEMGLHKELTEQQKKFAHELVTNEGRMTKYECAIAAGYAKDSARVRASELTNPKKYPLGCTIGYELYAKRKDKICFYGSTAKDFFGVQGTLDPCVLANRTNVVAHKARFEFFCQTRSCEFFAGWTHVFAGKNAPKETSWYLGIMIGF